MSGTSMIEQGGAASATLLLERGRDLMSATTSFLAGLGGSVFAVGNTELGPLFRQVDDLKRQVEAAQVITLSEALSRGVVAESDCPTATSWVIHWAPSFRSGGAAQLVTVTHATRAVRNATLAAAVFSARVGVRNAAVALAEVDKLKHSVSLSQPFDDDGIAEYRLRLDPEGKEVLEAIIGPLSAPKPTPGCSDLRSSDQRRGEALTEVCRRAAAAGGAAPVTTKAQVYVTISFDDLLNRAGAGTSLLTGQLLAPETVRRMACDATIIPIVLGTDSEVLDVGRADASSPLGSCEPRGCGTRDAASRAAPHPTLGRRPSPCALDRGRRDKPD